MDSEILRRENNDIHTTVATMQSSQADLLHRYKELQNNYSNLLQSVEEMKKSQLQQQILIKSLMQKNCKFLAIDLKTISNFTFIYS